MTNEEALEVENIELRRQIDMSEHRLPHDVQINHIVFKKGVPLSTLVAAATRWHTAAAEAYREKLGDENWTALRELFNPTTGSPT